MRYAIFEPTPVAAVERLKETLKGKVVYDLGAGDGKFAKAMGRFAKRVVAVETDPRLALECKWAGLETIQQSYMKIDLSKAEILYVFMGFVGLYALTKKLRKDNWHGILISHYYPMQDEPGKAVPANLIIDVEHEDGIFPLLIYFL